MIKRIFLALLICMPTVALAQSCNLPFTDTFSGSSGTPISSCWAQTTPSTEGLVVNGSNGAVLANPSTDNSYEMMTGANLISGTIKGTLSWSGTNPTGNVKMMLAGDTSGNFFIYDIVGGTVTVWSGGSFASTFMFGCPQPPAGGTSQPILSGDVISLTMTPGTPPAQTWTCKDETTGASATQVTPFPPYANGFGGISILQSNAVWSDIQITGTPVPVSVTTTTLCSGEVGTAYSCSASATGGTGRFNWTLTGTALPSPLVLDPTTCTNSTVPCQITGTPTTTSTTTGIIMTATDTASATASSPAMSIRIYPTPPPPGPGIPQLLCVESVANGTTTSCDTHGSTMNIVVVQADAACDPQVPAPFTDSEGNVYTRVSCSPAPGATGTSLWVSPNPHTSINTSWTTTSIIVPTAWAYIASGPDQTTSSLDGTDTGFITPTEDNELIFSYAAAQRPVAPPTSSPAALLASATDGFITEVGAWQNQVTAAPINNSFSWGGGTNGQVQAISSFFSTMNPGTLTVATQFVEEVAGQPCTSKVVPAGGEFPYVVSLNPSSPPMPSGAVLNSDGTITCSGTMAGITTGLIFDVTDSQPTPAHATSSAATLPIAATAVSVTTTDCPGTATQLVAFAGCTLTISGGYGPFTVMNPGLPDGMWPTITGTSVAITSPTVVYGQGDFFATIEAIDAYGASGSINLEWDVPSNNTFGGVTHLLAAGAIFYADISGLPVDTSPAADISTFGAQVLQAGFGRSLGIPITTVGPSQANITIQPNFDFSNITTGVGPIPCQAAIESGWGSVPIPNYTAQSDNHILVVQPTTGFWDFYQGYPGFPNGNGAPTCGGEIGSQIGIFGASWLWPLGYSGFVNNTPSADEAGLPITPLLLTYDEVAGGCAVGHECGEVTHPIRFTISKMLRGHVWPAQTFSPGPNVGSCSGGYVDPDGDKLYSQLDPPTSCTATQGVSGEIYRVPAGFTEPSTCSSIPSMHIVYLALKKRGIIAADNGRTGTLIGVPDPRWPDDLTIGACLGAITLGQMEPVNVQGIAADWLNSTLVTTAPSVISGYYGNVQQHGNVTIRH